MLVLLVGATHEAHPSPRFCVCVVVREWGINRGFTYYAQIYLLGIAYTWTPTTSTL